MMMTMRLSKWSVLLALAIGFLSCGGQAIKEPPKGIASETKTVKAGHPYLVKTQGSGPGDNVKCSLEDKKGNLWFGSSGEGVHKFDGELFYQFTESDGLISNSVFCIFEDDDGGIWIGTDNGLSFYDGNAFTDVHITAPVNSGHNKLYVFSIMKGENGEIWFATVEGVYVYDGKSFTLFVVDEDGKGYISEKNNTEYMLRDAAGNIWFGARVNDGVYRYDGDSIVSYKLKDLSGHHWAWPVLEDKNGDIWFSNWGGTYRYDGKTFKSFTKEDGLCSKVITRIIEDKKGNLWFGGGEGLCCYDGKKIMHFTTEDGLSHNGVWSVFEDSNGNIWVGTRNTGLCKYDGKAFINYSDK